MFFTFQNNSQRTLSIFGYFSDLPTGSLHFFHFTRKSGIFRLQTAGDCGINEREKPVRHGPHFQEEDNHADAQEEKSRPADGGVRRLLDPPPGGAPRPLARADARRAGAAGGARLRQGALYGRDGEGFRGFEINLRQGRSNFYVTSCGLNIAKLAVEKWDDGGDDCVMNENVHFWHHVPASVAYKYTEDADLAAKAKELAKEGRETCSLLYPYDLRLNPLRFLCVMEQLRRQKKKFRIYYPVKK